VKNAYHDDDGDDDGHTFNPVNRRFSWFPTWTEVLEEAEGQGDDRSDR
jgi:hypothetical protein